jgi:MFS transporter, DHA2 family, multidrug resistance protein
VFKPGRSINGKFFDITYDMECYLIYGEAISLQPSLTADLPPAGTRTPAPGSNRGGLHAIAGIGAVLLGAMISTLTSRITALGLSDIRGALGISFDEGAWINTAFSASQMFIGPIAIWAGFVFGTRRVLLTGAVAFMLTETILPWCRNFSGFMLAQALAGLSSGVFVPLTVGFIVRSLPPRLIPFGIAAYAMNLEMSLNISATLEGWYNEHLSWRWLFWQNAVLTIPFIFCLLTAIQQESIRDERSHGDYLGMLLGASGFACLLVALDQGERLFWLQSPFINFTLFAGLVLLVAFFVRELTFDNPGVALQYLLKPNVALLLLLVGLIRFTILNTSFIPSIFLAIASGLRPLQIGNTLRWIAVPQIAFAPVVAFMLLHIDPRRVISLGFATIAIAFFLGAQITPDWAEVNFIPSQLLQALGQTMALTSIVYFLGRHVTVEHALTFGAIVQATRLFSGQLGSTSIAVVQRVMEQTNSNMLGSHVTVFDAQTVERLHAQSAAFGGFPSGNPLLAPDGAFALIDQATRLQATTLSLADNYRLAAACAIGGVLLTFILRRAPAPPT